LDSPAAFTGIGYAVMQERGRHLQLEALPAGRVKLPRVYIFTSFFLRRLLQVC
jgi:hypothetical protein